MYITIQFETNILKMKNKKKLTYRLYFLTMYNISPIQQGIQCLHATVEMIIKGLGKKPTLWKPLWQWMTKDKTVVILNGGTSNDGTIFKNYGKATDLSKLGTMQKHVEYLKSIGVPYATFREPDLNGALSSIAILVDNRVFESEPMESDPATNKLYWHKSYINSIGGEKNVKLKWFLQNFRLA